MRDALPAVELFKPFLNRSKEFHPIRDLIERGVVGKFADCVEDEFFLRHGRNMVWSRLLGKHGRGTQRVRLSRP